QRVGVAGSREDPQKAGGLRAGRLREGRGARHGFEIPPQPPPRAAPASDNREANARGDAVDRFPAVAACAPRRERLARDAPPVFKMPAGHDEPTHARSRCEGRACGSRDLARTRGGGGAQFCRLRDKMREVKTLPAAILALAAWLV